MKYRVEYFQPREFICPCCGLGAPVASLVYFLDEFRRAWNMPVRVNSGFRCIPHNKEVGGVTSSRHLIGCAADVAPLDDALIGPFTSLLQDLAGRREGWELKMYPRFCHVAVPREESNHPWTGGVLNITVK